MQVQRIQNNNNSNTKPMFTSNVHIDFDSAKHIRKATRKGIKKLLNNGQNDVVFISLESSSWAPPEIIMNVIRRKTNKDFLIGFSKQLESNGVTKIYKDATKEMLPANMDLLFEMLA